MRSSRGKQISEVGVHCHRRQASSSSSQGISSDLVGGSARRKAAVEGALVFVEASDPRRGSRLSLAHPSGRSTSEVASVP